MAVNPADDSAPGAAPSGRDAVDESVRLLRVLWAWRVAILGVAVLAGLAGAGMGLLQPRQFEASATVAVSSARLERQPPGLVPVEAWVPLVSAAAVEQQVVEAAGVPDVTTVEQLRSRITVRALPLSNLIRISARASSADAAARLANAYADRGVASATALASIDVDALHGELKAMLDAADARLKAAEAAYDSYRKGARLEILEQEVATLATQRAELQEVNVDLASERARVARLEREAAAQQPVMALRQTVVDDPAFRAAAEQAGGQVVLGLEMRREVPNPLFEDLAGQLADARSQVAALEERRQRLNAAVGENGTRLVSVTRMYDHESQLERLSSERELARKSYEAVAAEYQGAKLSAVGRTAQLLVVSPAVPLADPLPRFLAFKALFGASAGFLLVSVVVIGREAFRAR